MKLWVVRLVCDSEMIEWDALTEIQDEMVRDNSGKVAIITKRDKGET
jgi:hypothetical protein